ncbi:MAG: MmcQ/YjbR family DNA-binding protein [Egibacteraceae bacterium]
MDLDELRAHCVAKPAVTEEYPFGPGAAVFKVAGKMFAIAEVDAAPFQFSVKCEPDLAVALRQSYAAVQPGYHLNKRHWNTVVCDGSIPDATLGDFLDDSYDLVVDGLPRRLRDAL